MASDLINDYNSIDVHNFDLVFISFHLHNIIFVSCGLYWIYKAYSYYKYILPESANKPKKE